MNKNKIVVISLALFIGIGIILAVSVFMRTGEEYVDLGSPPHKKKTDAPGKKKPLRFCVASMWSPKETFVRYRRLGERLGRLMGIDQTFVVSSTYREVRKSLKEGSVDIALTCTGTLVNLAPTNAVDVLVVPEFMEGWEYRGYLIVPAGSPARTLHDLKGGTMAMTDPESLTGCIVPSGLLYSLEPHPKNFLRRVVFTGNHDRAIEAVASGLVDAGAVDALVYSSMCRESPRIKKGTRILWQSPEYGPPPVLVPRSMPAALKDKLRSILLSIHEDEAGFAILRSLAIRRFILPPKGVYDSAIDLFHRVQAAGGCPWP